MKFPDNAESRSGKIVIHLVVGITERALGCNANIRTAVLEFLMENPAIKDSESMARELFVKLNLVGGVKNLPFLEVGEIKELLTILKPDA